MPVTRPAPRVEGVCIGWLTAFVDRDGVTFNEAVRFWLAATGSTLSTPRGDHTEFATLVPFDGDAYLRVQRVDVGGGSHLDLHVRQCRGIRREPPLSRSSSIGRQWRTHRAFPTALPVETEDGIAVAVSKAPSSSSLS